jgi:hypothetical protein
MGLLMFATIGFFAVAVIISNQSTLDNATSVAAQGAIVTYDRGTADLGLSSQSAEQSADSAATYLFTENSGGLIPDPFSGSKPGLHSLNVCFRFATVPAYEAGSSISTSQCNPASTGFINGSSTCMDVGSVEIDETSTGIISFPSFSGKTQSETGTYSASGYAASISPLSVTGDGSSSGNQSC